jgi:hypothetical protein
MLHTTTDGLTDIINGALPPREGNVPDESHGLEGDLMPNAEPGLGQIPFAEFERQYPNLSGVVCMLAEQYVKLLCSGQIGVHNIMAPRWEQDMRQNTAEYAINLSFG